jgi:hypothetical protein
MTLDSDDARRSPKWASRATVVASVVLFLALVVRYWDHTVDDAFISFRYARNLAHGLGLVFNAGERVEGYTNFLWVIVLAAGEKVGILPETLARLAGTAAGAGVIVVVVRFAARRVRSLPALAVPLAFLSAHPALAAWSTGGLETTLFALFATYAACRVAEEIERDELSARGAVAAAAAALTRPEGVMIAAALAAVTLAYSTRSRQALRRWALWTGLFVALWAPYFAWRWSYYGYPLPNTFYAKVDPGGSQLGRGLAYLDAFGWITGYWLLPLVAGLALRKLDRAAVILGSVLVPYVAFIAYVGGDGLPMYRFVVPWLGLLVILAALGAESWANRFPQRRVAVAALWALLACGGLSSIRPNFTGRDHDFVQQDVREVGAWTAIGRWFKEHAPEGSSIAVLPAGAIPYYSELVALDMLGLNDVEIAHTPVRMGAGQAGHEKFNLEYVLRRDPTFVVVGVYALSNGTSLPQVTPYYPIELALLSSPVFRERYRPVVASTAGGAFTFFARVPYASREMNDQQMVRP